MLSIGCQTCWMKQGGFMEEVAIKLSLKVF